MKLKRSSEKKRGDLPTREVEPQPIEVSGPARFYITPEGRVDGYPGYQWATGSVSWQFSVLGSQSNCKQNIRDAKPAWFTHTQGTHEQEVGN